MKRRSVLSGALDGWLDTLRSELRLEPSSFADDSAEWSAGGLRGTLSGMSSPFVEWGVRYANEAAGGKSLGFNLWLTSQLPAPHLTLYVGVRHGRATLMADHLPRFDSATHPDHVDRFYGGEEVSGGWLAAEDSGLTFRSADPAVRALQGPNAIALSGAASDPWCWPPSAMSSTATSVCGSIGRSARRSWSILSRWAPSSRDRAVRRALRDHERRAGRR